LDSCLDTAGGALVRGAIALALLALVGCASLAPGLPPPSAEEIASQNVSWGIRTLGPDGQFEVLRSNVVAERLRAHLRDRPLSVLVLSSGGSAGAFGAGIIVGWTRSQSRPDFSVVTGVSAGALIAPLAFLGSAWDPQISEVYTTGVSQGVLRRRFFSGLFGSSVYSNSRLRRLIEYYADDTLLDAVAKEAGKGRLLLVATTDLATGQPVIWDLTSIAMHGGPDAKPVFRSILLASASVPGMLPPVMINVHSGGIVQRETHVDGGLTLPFFVAPAADDLPLTAGDSARTVVRVIINGSLSGVPSVTKANALSIFRRSVSAAMTWMTKSTLEHALAVSRAKGIDFEYAAIPANYPLGSSFNFAAATQRSLFQYAATCAQKGRLWSSAYRMLADEAIHRIGAPEILCPAEDSYLAGLGEDPEQ
jgi:predicted acylesterase/phospholipase RssA